MNFYFDTENIQFEIDHIDPLGQGVFKKKDQIYFLAKTLPGEKGQAKIFKKRKGVHFGHLENEKNLSEVSPDRVSSPCPHFSNCPGCHFLHTSYEKEISFKRDALKKHFSFLGIDLNDLPFQIIPSNQRFSYRNRVQLHYNLKKKKLGAMNGFTNDIVEIPSCLLPIPEVKEAIQKLYHQLAWIKEASQQRPFKNQGHVEIYLPPGQKNPLITWNQPYATTGFSQVNQELNDVLKSHLKSSFEVLSSQDHTSGMKIPNAHLKTPVIFDLFGGSGNLGQDLQPSQSWVLDLNVPKDKLKNHQKGVSINLFEAESLQKFYQNVKLAEPIDFFLVDPPRNGFPLLQQWTSSFSPNYIFYISCYPSTLMRDIKEILPSYQLNKVFLFDFFPSTYHFETMVILQKR